MSTDPRDKVIYDRPRTQPTQPYCLVPSWTCSITWFPILPELNKVDKTAVEKLTFSLVVHGTSPRNKSIMQQDSVFPGSTQLLPFFLVSSRTVFDIYVPRMCSNQMRPSPVGSRKAISTFVFSFFQQSHSIYFLRRTSILMLFAWPKRHFCLKKKKISSKKSIQSYFKRINQQQ